MTDQPLPATKHGTAKNWGTCRSCRATVLWVTTKAGKPMPVDPETDESHFASCPEAESWRRGR